MSFSDVAIKVSKVNKIYEIYIRPSDKLKQLVRNCLQMIFGRFYKQYYSEFFSLKNVSFEVKKGETVAIIGTNGSGKSTLLQLICGTLYPTSGEVIVSGRVAALLELGAGFNPEFTGRENVYLNGVVLGLSVAEIDNRIGEILDFAGIGQFIDQPVKTYSSGMLVRLAFSVAINVNPEILIIDEALAVGDARFQSKCLDKIHSMRKQGVTILFVSHDMTSVRSLCNKVIWLDKGMLRDEGDVALLTANYLNMIFSDDGLSHNRETFSSNKKSNSEIEGEIARWGSHVGCILRLSMVDMEGNILKTAHEQKITIKCCFQMPKEIDKNNLHLAISIKNLAGLDVIVRSTYDEPRLNLAHLSGFSEVSFTMFNILNTGEYMLSVGLEDRSKSAINYYEYIDGAYYFNSVSNQQRYGIVVPEVKCHLS